MVLGIGKEGLVVTMVEPRFFKYDNECQEMYLEGLVRRIDQLMGYTIASKAEIGKWLDEAKDTLGHGKFGEWLDCKWGMSVETARKYRHLNRSIQADPRILDFHSVELAFMFPTLPEKVQEQIIAREAYRYSEAMQILAQDWSEGVQALIDRGDSGDAYHEIAQGLEDANLREEAVRLMQENSELFARQMDFSPEEVMKDAGMNLDERYPTALYPNSARLKHGDEGIHILAGEEEIAFYPMVKETNHQAMQNDAIIAACRALRIKTEWRG